MSFLHDLGRDLAERKLWPLAAAPPVALLAVVALGGGSDAPRPVPAAAPQPVPAETRREIERLADRRDRVRPAQDRPAAAGRRDPFTGRAPGARGGAPAPAPDAGRPAPRAPRETSPADIVRAAQQAAQANARAVASAAAAAAPAAAAPARGPVRPAPVPAPTAPAPSAQRPPARPEAVRVADVRLSPEGEVAPARRDVASRTALPSVGRVVVVVRAVEDDVVEVAVRPGARVRGGRCLPARRTCRALRLAVGGVARIALPGAGGRASVHRLRVLRVGGARPAEVAPSEPARCLSAALDLTQGVAARLASSTAADWAGAARRCRPGA